MKNQIESQSNIPRYQQIAIEIATRIACEEYKLGEKIYARSSIASQFKVSPETARRAICVLSDLDIVVSEKGSGVTIKSYQNAVNYISQYKQRQTFDSIKDNIMQSIIRQQNEMLDINKQLSELINASEHYRSLNPFMPFKIKITDKCAYLGKSISDMQFWQHTGATILAVERKANIYKSPGPYFTLEENDIVYFLPQDDASQQVKDFLYP